MFRFTLFVLAIIVTLSNAFYIPSYLYDRPQYLLPPQLRDASVHVRGEASIKLDPTEFNIGKIKGVIGGSAQGNGEGTIVFST
ncbi:uncharacterized protein LOC126888279 isoform X4 [Diabrotica virgifera virgifera]|uniref:Uncharacterized protein LOC114340550 isoform X4 n=1 Tax=Diabrotica virgifera virgifera TaxID=50390 RepID=A0A6P7GMA3_DIAVI|nr:uncharacterized protein LOC126888279 isoform X4 [Diabrotica virgifera virgifera]